jgi:type VI secretion system secreted protein VgrG
MCAFGQTNRLLTFTSPLGADVLLPERIRGFEGISELFRYEVDLLAVAETAVDPKDIVGKKACVQMQVSSVGARRSFHGFVAALELNGGDREFHNFRAVIVPSIWPLTLNRDTRVFQNKTVVEIIRQIAADNGVALTVDCSASYPQLDYCTQYRESDFAFISRLMEQFGIFYYFKHSPDNDVFVLNDNSSVLSACPVQDKFRYAPQGSDSEGFYDFVIDSLASRSTMVPGKYSLWDYSFIRYGLVSRGPKNTAGPLGDNPYEQYDYADSAAGYVKIGTPKTDGLADLFLDVRGARGDAETLIAEGSSNAISLESGYTFQLLTHPQSSLNVRYLATHVEHDAQQVPSYRTVDDPRRPYTNAFVAVPFSIPYRPPIRTPRPVVHGMHTGQVVVPSGEDSYMDKYGRVCVQFWWDRVRHPNTPDHTLLRVAQSWAGKGWGSYFWPRVGDEVLIDFIEGDPDQPIVVGSVYNGINVPKYNPAGQYTLSGILTRSSKQGGEANANELRFEDLKDKEQIYMNAERDYDLHVEHDWHSLIGNERHITVDKSHFEQIGGDKHMLVKGKQLQEIDGESDLNVKGAHIVEVGGDHSHKVGGSMNESVGGTYGMTVSSNLVQQVGSSHSLVVGKDQDSMIGQSCSLTAGQTINLLGGTSVNITGGSSGVSIVGPGGFISITEEGISIMGTMVMINSGGAPTPANPANADTPSPPTAPTAPTAPTFPGDDPPSNGRSGGNSDQ